MSDTESPKGVNLPIPTEVKALDTDPDPSPNPGATKLRRYW